jgi:hypothetical protein
MATTERTRPPELSRTPRAFRGSAAEIDNADRWLRYLIQYVQYPNLRDEDLFKLRVTDQAQDWLYALPEDQTDSFHSLQEAFMKRNVANPLQRYQKASHMWSQVQQPVDACITALKTAANQIQLTDEQQLCYCIIRGLKPALRLHVLQNEHDTLEAIQNSSRVSEIATAGVGDNKTVAELTRAFTLLVDKLTAKDTAASRQPPPPWQR